MIEGFEALSEDQTVIHGLSVLVKGTLLAQPTKVPPKLKLFGAKKSVYYNMIFTKYSPLQAMFQMAATETFENGQYDRTVVKWQGAPVKSSSVVDLIALNPGQVFLIFGLLLGLISLALIFLALEFVRHYIVTQSQNGKYSSGARKGSWVQNLKKAF